MLLPELPPELDGELLLPEVLPEPLLPEPPEAPPEAADDLLLSADFFLVAACFLVLCDGVPDAPLVSDGVEVWACANCCACCSTAAIFCGSVLSVMELLAFWANDAADSVQSEAKMAMGSLFMVCSCLKKRGMMRTASAELWMLTPDSGYRIPNCGNGNPNLVGNTDDPAIASASLAPTCCDWQRRFFRRRLAAAISTEPRVALPRTDL